MMPEKRCNVYLEQRWKLWKLQNVLKPCDRHSIERDLWLKFAAGTCPRQCRWHTSESLFCCVMLNRCLLFEVQKFQSLKIVDLSIISYHYSIYYQFVFGFGKSTLLFLLPDLLNYSTLWNRRKSHFGFHFQSCVLILWRLTGSRVSILTIGKSSLLIRSPQVLHIYRVNILGDRFKELSKSLFQPPPKYVRVECH